MIGRRRLLRRAVIAAGLGAALILWLSTVSAIQDERSRWTSAATVAVLVDAREAGEEVGAEHVELVELPLGALPDDAIVSGEAFGGAASGPLYPGDVLRRRDIHENLDVVPSGQRAIAIPVDDNVPLVEPGDRVELIVFAETGGAFSDDTVEVIAGRVLTRNEGSVVVAIPDTSASLVAAGIVHGRFVLAAA